MQLKNLKKIRFKEKYLTRNFVHHLINKIIKDSKGDILVLENLKGLKQSRKKFTNKNKISQIPFSMIKIYLTYKALLFNKQTITVSPSYTSQIDHRTGNRDGIRKGCRYYGKDGIIMHSDINAAINIGLKSKLPVSQNRNILTYGQAIVNSPIVNQLKNSFANS